MYKRGFILRSKQCIPGWIWQLTGCAKEQRRQRQCQGSEFIGSSVAKSGNMEKGRKGALMGA